MSVSIEGLDRAAVLAALYNGATPQGLGFLNYDSNPMTVDEARSHLAQGSYFDYLKGRVMKVDLRDSNSFDEGLYDRDNGRGAAQRIVNELRQSGTVLTDAGSQLHETNKRDKAEVIKGELDTPHTVEERDGMSIFHLGVGDMKDRLLDAFRKNGL